MRRRVVKFVLPLLGMFVAFIGVIYFQSDVPRLLSVLVGILLVEAGTWKAANPLLYSARTYLELRAEAENFLGRLRAMNQAATEARHSDDPKEWARYRSIVEEMHDSVDRMAQLAGKEEGMEDIPPPES